MNISDQSLHRVFEFHADPIIGLVCHRFLRVLADVPFEYKPLNSQRRRNVHLEPQIGLRQAQAAVHGSELWKFKKLKFSSYCLLVPAAVHAIPLFAWSHSFCGVDLSEATRFFPDQRIRPSAVRDFRSYRSRTPDDVKQERLESGADEAHGMNENSEGGSDEIEYEDSEDDSCLGVGNTGEVASNSAISEEVLNVDGLQSQLQPACSSVGVDIDDVPFVETMAHRSMSKGSSIASAPAVTAAELARVESLLLSVAAADVPHPLTVRIFSTAALLLLRILQRKGRHCKSPSSAGLLLSLVLPCSAVDAFLNPVIGARVTSAAVGLSSFFNKVELYFSGGPDGWPHGTFCRSSAMGILDALLGKPNIVVRCASVSQSSVLWDLLAERPHLAARFHFDDAAFVTADVTGPVPVPEHEGVELSKALVTTAPCIVRRESVLTICSAAPMLLKHGTVPVSFASLSVLDLNLYHLLASTGVCHARGLITLLPINVPSVRCLRVSCGGNSTALFHGYRFLVDLRNCLLLEELCLSCPFHALLTANPYLCLTHIEGRSSMIVVQLGDLFMPALAYEGNQLVPNLKWCSTYWGAVSLIQDPAVLAQMNLSNCGALERLDVFVQATCALSTIVVRPGCVVSAFHSGPTLPRVVDCLGWTSIVLPVETHQEGPMTNLQPDARAASVICARLSSNEGLEFTCRPLTMDASVRERKRGISSGLYGLWVHALTKELSLSHNVQIVQLTDNRLCGLSIDMHGVQCKLSIEGPTFVMRGNCSLLTLELCGRFTVLLPVACVHSLETVVMREGARVIVEGHGDILTSGLCRNIPTLSHVASSVPAATCLLTSLQTHNYCEYVPQMHDSFCPVPDDLSLQSSASRQVSTAADVGIIEAEEGTTLREALFCPIESAAGGQRDHLLGSEFVLVHEGPPVPDKNMSQLRQSVQERSLCVEYFVSTTSVSTAEELELEKPVVAPSLLHSRFHVASTAIPRRP